MIQNLYAKYLLADRLNKIAESAGLRIYETTIGHGDSEHSYAVSVQLSLASDRSPEGNERAAVFLLLAMPELTLKRRDGLIYLHGTTDGGLTFRFYTGTGVCERIQVGTRIVPAQPAQPEREEPIFEVVCADALSEAVSA